MSFIWENMVKKTENQVLYGKIWFKKTENHYK